MEGLKTSYFVEASSDDTQKAPTVLVNIGGGPMNYIDVYSQMAGNASCRIVFNNGQDLKLEGYRCETFLRALQHQGCWESSTQQSTGAAGRTQR